MNDMLKRPPDLQLKRQYLHTPFPGPSGALTIYLPSQHLQKTRYYQFFDNFQFGAREGVAPPDKDKAVARVIVAYVPWMVQPCQPQGVLRAEIARLDRDNAAADMSALDTSDFVIMANDLDDRPTFLDSKA